MILPRIVEWARNYHCPEGGGFVVGLILAAPFWLLVWWLL
jgi:hypothetical protein